MHDVDHGHTGGSRASQRLMPTGPDGYGDASQLDNGHEDAKPAAPMSRVGLARGASGSAVLAARGGVTSTGSSPAAVAYTPPSAAGADDGDLGGGRVFFSDARA